MRILMLAPAISIHSLRPLNWLLESGHEVIFMDFKNPYPEGRERYYYVPYPYGEGMEILTLEHSHADELLVIQKLRDIYYQFKPDVVHVHWIDHRAYQCVKAGLRPLVFSVWGSDINEHFKPDFNPKVARHLIGETLRGADLLIIDAPEMAQKCAYLAGQEVRTVLLHLGINTKFFRPGDHEANVRWRHKLSIPTDAVVFLSARALQPFYNHHFILHAFYLAKPHFLNPAILVFKIYNYHDHQEYEMELRRRSIDMGIDQWVRWINQVPHEQLPEVYAFADIILNDPPMDSFPITFLEAAACEKPVITCRLPSYAGTFAERCFRTFELNDINGLVNAMINMVNEPSSRKTDLLFEARRIVVQEYDESLYIKKLLEIYDELRIKSNKQDNQTVSVVIPTYNRQRFLPRAIDSVLRQTYPVSEILVVDDGSTDDTPQLIAEAQKHFPLIKYIRLDKNSGAQNARNVGINAASGEWIGFLDSDDEWLPDRVRLALEAAHRDGVSVTHCEYIRQEPDGHQFLQRVPPLHGNVYLDFLRSPNSTFPGLLLKKECLIAIGGLDTSIMAWQEWDVLIRLSKLYEFAYVPEPLFIWHWHDEPTISKDEYRSNKGYQQIFEKHEKEILEFAGRDAFIYHLQRIYKIYQTLNAFTEANEILNKINSYMDITKNG